MSGIADDDVVTVGDPRLKAETHTIGDVHDVADLMARMVNRLRELNGAGLAAPQIGASVKVVVVEYLSAEGANATAQYSGYVVRVIQHAIDHLNGIEFIDRMRQWRT